MAVKWILIRTLFTYCVILFLLYLCFALNACLFHKRQIQNYKSVSTRIPPVLVFNGYKGYEYVLYRQQNNAPTEKRLPDALIIGVRKCGTRAVLAFLSLHPDVSAARTEIHFFDKYYNKGLKWYRDQMPPSVEGQITLEKTPSYWLTRTVPRKVFAMNPAVKLLAVVRDPVTRAVSDYAQFASKKSLYPSFEDMAFKTKNWNEKTRYVVRSEWPPIQRGFYGAALKMWLEKFPRSSLHLVNGEKLVTDPAGEMARIQKFLGLRLVITKKNFYYNSSKGFPCFLRNNTPHCLGNAKGRSHPYIHPVAIEKLRDFYRPLNKQFYKMAGIDFGWP